MSGISTRGLGLGRSRRGRARGRLLGSSALPLYVGLAMVALMVVLAISAPLLTPYGPDDPDVAAILVPPGTDGHVLGTDALGRDLFTRILYGARTSLIVASAGVVLSMTLGVSMGLLAAFGGKWGERGVRWAIDVQLAFPYVLLAIAITSVVTPSLGVLIMLMMLAGWAAFARVIRSSAMSEISRDYVKAAMLTGASRIRIARKYVLPVLLPPILVLAAMQMAAMVVFEATLSFLGMGVQPPTASWGGIMLGGVSYLDSGWWISTLPGFAILWLTMSLLLIVDGLQNRLRTRVV